MAASNVSLPFSRFLPLPAATERVLAGLEHVVYAPHRAAWFGLRHSGEPPNSTSLVRVPLIPSDGVAELVLPSVLTDQRTVLVVAGDFVFVRGPAAEGSFILRVSMGLEAHLTRCFPISGRAHDIFLVSFPRHLLVQVNLFKVGREWPPYIHRLELRDLDGTVICRADNVGCANDSWCLSGRPACPKDGVLVTLYSTQETHRTLLPPAFAAILETPDDTKPLSQLPMNENIVSDGAQLEPCEQWPVFNEWRVDATGQFFCRLHDSSGKVNIFAYAPDGKSPTKVADYNPRDPFPLENFPDLWRSDDQRMWLDDDRHVTIPRALRSAVHSCWTPGAGAMLVWLHGSGADDGLPDLGGPLRCRAVVALHLWHVPWSEMLHHRTPAAFRELVREVLLLYAHAAAHHLGSERADPRQQSTTGHEDVHVSAGAMLGQLPPELVLYALVPALWDVFQEPLMGWRWNGATNEISTQ